MTSDRESTSRRILDGAKNGGKHGAQIRHARKELILRRLLLFRRFQRKASKRRTGRVSHSLYSAWMNLATHESSISEDSLPAFLKLRRGRRRLLQNRVTICRTCCGCIFSQMIRLSLGRMMKKSGFVGRVPRVANAPAFLPGAIVFRPAGLCFGVGAKWFPGAERVSTFCREGDLTFKISDLKDR